MREWWRRGAAAAAIPLAVGAIAAMLVARGPAPRRHPAATAPRPVPYALYTRCGIDYAHVGNRYYEAASPAGGPWHQPGTLTTVSRTQAVFTDKTGHRRVFTLVSSGPARPTARVCP